MGRIVVCTNPLDPEEREIYRYNGPVIDWLAKNYPNGFPTPHVASLNLRRLPVEDYDTSLGDEDVLVLVIFPADPVSMTALFVGWGMSAGWAAVTAAVVGTLISVGLSYAINALFGPKAGAPTSPQGFAGAAAAGSVYSLATPTNLARIGQPIQVPYGRNIIVPDQAMQPYSYFSGNQQYVCQLMVIGQGEYEIEEIKVASSNVAELGDGVVEYSIWPASAHGQTFGVIQNATGIHENVYTSAEVTDQELVGDLVGGFSAPANLWNGTWSTFSGGIFYINSDEPARQYVQMLKNGTPVWAVVTGGIPAGNDGAYQVGFIEGAGYTQEYNDNGDVIYAYGRKGHLGPCAEPTWSNTGACVGPTWPAGNGTGIVSLTVTPPGSGNLGAPLGPYAASPSCMLTEHMQYDIVFPNGCFKADPESGVLLPFNVQIRFVAELIDNTGVALGPSYETLWSEDLATNTPQRRTLDHWVPKGRYRVTAERLSGVSDLAQDQSKCIWVGLKSILGLYCDDSGVPEIQDTSPDYYTGPGGSGEDVTSGGAILGQMESGTYVTADPGVGSGTLYVPTIASPTTIVYDTFSAQTYHPGCAGQAGLTYEELVACRNTGTLLPNVTYVQRLNSRPSSVRIDGVSQAIHSDCSSFKIAATDRLILNDEFQEIIASEIENTCIRTTGYTISFYPIGSEFFEFGCTLEDPKYVQFAVVAPCGSNCGSEDYVCRATVTIS